jgi:hypothetical protein
MADRDKPTDIDKLLAEVDAMTTGGGAAARRPAPPPPASTEEAGGFMVRVRTAATAGVVGAGVVWVIFAVLPFLRAGSGAIGAFLATFVAVLLLRRR